MKPQPHQNASAPQVAGQSPTETRFVREGEVQASSLRRPPIVPRRRYPSLSDEGQPYFPRLRRKSRRTDESMTDARASFENDQPVVLSVRFLAMLAIVVIIAALMAAA